MKKCSKCGEEKLFVKFSKNNARKDGLGSHCRACKCAATKRWRREKRNKVARRWRKENPEKERASKSRRRASRLGAIQGDPTDAAAYEQILRQGICELCGAKGPIHVDHIEALSTGGEHGWENFAGLCPSCNGSKHDKSLLLSMLS
jgi:5-methylcytosine-specific restriction endonuclease McrA